MKKKSENKNQNTKISTQKKERKTFLSKHNDHQKKVKVEKPIYKEKKKGEQKEFFPMFKTTDMLGLVIVTCMVSLFVGYIFGTRTILKSNKMNVPKGMNKVIDTFKDIKENYYEDVKDETLINGAIRGMLAALGDPYATFIEGSSNSFDVRLDGNYEGIGIEVFNNKDQEIEITSVFENSSASKAGLQKGDIILSLNKENIRKESTSTLVNKIKKLKDDKFQLTILRGTEEKTVTVQRQHIEIPAVDTKIYEKGEKKIGYISLEIFSVSAYQQFKEKLEDLEKNKIDSLIIDVRGNSGGHLSTVTDLLALFLDKSHVIYQTQKKDDIQKFYSQGKVTKKYPIVLLTNEGSASASELLVAALKEEYEAITIGKTTYGKGTVQELKDVNQGEYKFTTKKWLTPKGNWIHGKGISPDIEVELSETYLENPSEENDSQLARALEYLQEK